MAELIIYRRDGQKLFDDEYDKVISLHYRLQKVQWPTVLAFLKPLDADVEEYVACLRANRANCSLEMGGQMMKSEVYEVKWVPDTVFQLAVILSVVIDSPPTESKREDETVMTFKLPEHLRDLDYTEAIDQVLEVKEEERKKKFYDASIEFGHKMDREYFSALKYYEKFSGEDWNAQIDSMLMEWIKLFKWRDGRKDLYVLKEDYPLSYWMDPYMDEAMKIYVRREVRAAKKNFFILTRGTRGVGVKFQVNDEDRELIPTLDMPLIDYSISFSTRLLDGSMLDFEPRIGARCLTYLFDPSGRKRTLGYMLSFSILPYIILADDQETPSIFTHFYIPPLSCISGLFGKFEIFHPRTKMGDHREITDKYGYNKETLPKLFDLSVDLGIFHTKHRASQLMYSFQELLHNSKPFYRKDPELMRDFQRRSEGHKLLFELVRGEKSYQITLCKDKRSPEISFSSESPFDLDTIQHSIPYQSDNLFHRLITGAQSFSTPIYHKNDFAIAFGSPTPLVHTHIVIIPCERPFGEYVRFYDLIKHSSDAELVSFFRTMHKAAEMARWIRAMQDDSPLQDLVKDGYRMVINSVGKAANHAHQDVMHLHAHLGGGQALEPVTKKGHQPPEKALVETLFAEYRENDMVIKVYEQTETAETPAEFILEMTDLEGNHLFKSFHHFAGHASVQQIRKLGLKVIQLALEKGFLETGFRIYSNHSQESTSHFRMHVAYGSPLSENL